MKKDDGTYHMILYTTLGTDLFMVLHSSLCPKICLLKEGSLDWNWSCFYHPLWKDQQKVCMKKDDGAYHLILCATLRADFPCGTV